jgi:hypothetical protein
MQKTVNLSKVVLALIIILGLIVNVPSVIEFVAVRANPVSLLGSLVPLVFLPAITLYLITGRRVARIAIQTRLFIIGAYFCIFAIYIALIYMFLSAFRP